MGDFSILGRRIRAVVVIIIVGISVCGSSAASANDSSSFGYPLKDHTITKAFVEPEFEYGPGHRGVSFYAKPQTPVFASADGEVVFAGQVAGFLHITLSHGKDFKTTYTNLGTKTVRLGDHVTKGQLLGTTGVKNFSNESDTFLFTMRYQGKYVDPVKYLTGEKIVRNIRLAEFPKQPTAFLSLNLQREKKAIEMLIDPIRPGELADKFSRYLSSKGLESLKGLAKSGIDSYNNAVGSIHEMKEIVEKIAQDRASGFKSGIDEGIRKLKKLEKLLIVQLKQAFKDLEKFSREIVKQYSRALSIGNQAAIWFLETMADIVTLPFEMAISLELLANDLLDSAGNSTLKILNQYAKFDIPTILRAIVVPGSCLLETCSKAIVLKCDPKAKFKVRSVKDGYKGSGNGLLVLAGLGTSGEMKDGKIEPTLNLPIEVLGYDKSEVEYFSYSGKSKSYEDTDTYNDLNIAAKNMDEQVRDYKHRNPNKKLDLTAHSLGGAVVSLWLAKYYDPADKSYPQIGKVTMLAPPLNGTALANGREILEGQKDGKVFVESIGKLIPRVTSKSVGQVSENGEIAKIVTREKPLAKVDVQTIRLAPDFVVTSATQSAPGANEVVLPSTNLLNAHSGMVTDQKVIDTMQHFLEGSKPSCPSFAESATSVVQASVVRSSELYVSRSLRDWSDTQNTRITYKFVSELAA